MERLIKKNKTYSKIKGFTLIELLVVISIISFLSSVILASLSTAREKARITAGLQFEANVLHTIGDHLDAEYTFDKGDFSDSSGNNHSGNTSLTYSSDTPTGKGKSAAFNGSQVLIDLDVSEATYSTGLWFKTTSSNGGMFEVQKSSSDYDRTIFLSSGNVCTYMWQVETICSSGKNYADNKWHYVLHTFGSATGGQEIYIDGQKVAKGNKSYSDFSWQTKISIGATTAGGNGFSGLIDNVRVYSNSLSN